MSYMADLAKAAGNEYGSLVDDGIFGGDVTPVSYTHLRAHET